jgi:hypothetical protein
VIGRSSNLTRRALIFGWAALVLGVVLWWVLMASASGEETGNGTFYWWMLLAAAVLGVLAADREGWCGVALGVGPLVLAPWTAPRGDGDGLWVLALPVLLVYPILLMLVAAGSARLAGLLRQ